MELSEAPQNVGESFVTLLTFAYDRLRQRRKFAIPMTFPNCGRLTDTWKLNVSFPSSYCAFFSITFKERSQSVR